jgi:hypothetical protein
MGKNAISSFSFFFNEKSAEMAIFIMFYAISTFSFFFIKKRPKRAFPISFIKKMPKRLFFSIYFNFFISYFVDLRYQHYNCRQSAIPPLICGTGTNKGIVAPSLIVGI